MPRSAKYTSNYADGSSFMCFLKLHVPLVSTPKDMHAWHFYSPAHVFMLTSLFKKKPQKPSSTHYLVLSLVGDLVFLQLNMTHK